MSRETILDDAIAKAKEAEDWQLADWLRMARGGQSAARWYAMKLGKREAENIDLRNKLVEESALRVNAEFENAKLRELVKKMYECIRHANEQDWFYFELDKQGCGMSCVVNGERCGLLVLADRMHELGIEVE